MGFYAYGLSLQEVNYTVLQEPQLRLYWAAEGKNEQKLQVADWKIIGTSAQLKFYKFENLYE